MSAFIVDKAHINALVRLAIHYRVQAGADELGTLLIRENVQSVRYRYPDDTPATLPGPGDHYWMRPVAFRHNPTGPLPTPVEGLKLVQCYEYQSCEHPGWEQSAARECCHALTAALIAALPGYEEAPWVWAEPTATPSSVSSMQARTP